MATEGGRPTTDMTDAKPAPQPDAANDLATPKPAAETAVAEVAAQAAPEASHKGTALDVATAGEQPPPEGKPELSPDLGHTRAASRPLSLHRHSLERQLFEESYFFDFFQAVRLLQRLDPGRVGVGRGGPPTAEVVRFRAHISLSFPPSAIYELRRPTTSLPVPVMVQAFMGLTGPSGVLPRHYSELLYKIKRDAKGLEKHALRDWLDLFNHRLVSLFYRAWEKYRFTIPFERGEHNGAEPDPFTNTLYSLIGLGARPLRRRLRVATRDIVDEYDKPKERVLARIEDLFLVHFSGILAHRPRCAVALEAMVQDYFQVPARLNSFQGQWLQLEPPNRTHLDGELGNNQLGVSAVAGDRVWERQSKFRMRLGPMTYAQFTDLLPDRDPVPERKAFFLLAHLIRLYAEPTLDFDVQLVLKAQEVPECQVAGGTTFGARLGWNTWLLTRAMSVDAEDVVLEGEDVVLLEETSRLSGLHTRTDAS